MAWGSSSRSAIKIGPYRGTLVDRPEACQILDFDVCERGGGTELPLLPTLVDDLLLPGCGVLEWLFIATKLTTGALLIVGPFSGGAAPLVFAQHVFLQLIRALAPASLVGCPPNRPNVRWPS